MNTAASSEKMNAWMNATRISSTMMKSAMTTGGDGDHDQPNMKISPMSARMMTWPAIMFAKRRIVSANGFVNFPTISTGVMMMRQRRFITTACRAASR